MSREWTPEQQTAMEKKGGAILVSAAAGSGKTAVLVERIIRRITDENDPVQADRLLVVTFTNAAAAEMRDRIAARLRELLAQRPGDTQLEQQLIRLQKAKICTMDAFFSALVREHFEKLSISPSIRIAEEAELADLRAGAMDKIMEESYEENGPDFLAAVQYFGEQSDDRLREEVLYLSNKVSSLPRPERWFRQQIAAYEHPVPPTDSIWGEFLLHHAEELLRAALHLNESIEEILADDEFLQKGYGKAIADDKQLLKTALEIAGRRQWDELSVWFGTQKPGNIGRAPKQADPDLKETAVLLRGQCKEYWQEAAACLPCREAGHREDCARLLPAVRGLMALTQKFQKEFFAARQESNLADFSDMAYFALHLCTDEDGAPTDLAREIAEGFDEILLDEYQDTNRLQDEIFHAISKEGRNLFFVGDLKQSIYRFRSADPAVFTEKQETFSEDGSFPALLRLSKNFRSRAGVLDAVNCVFSQIMSRRLGGVRYDTHEMVHPGASYPERTSACLQLQLIDLQQSPEESDRILLEAEQTARRVAKMLKEGYPVTEDGELRPCRPTDFAILLRSLKGVESIFCEALQNEGVSAAISSAEGYFTSREVLLMISLLQVLDNPLQDIPLAAVMLSPLGLFSCDDISALRLTHPEDRLYTALLTEQEHLPRAAAFLELLQNLREKSAVKQVRSLIQYIYDSTDFLEIMAAGEKGNPAGREANLKLLLQYAGDYERGSHSGLSGFVSYIRRIMDRGEDFKVANPLSTENGMVRILSVHKSKGLEFPIVILANCSKKFNFMDSNRTAVYHPVMGYGMQVVNRKTLQKYPTLSSAAVSRMEREETVSEELRLLYVAMTRARETLILNISERNLSKEMAAAVPFLTQYEIEPVQMMQMTSWSQWLLAALIRHPDFAAMRDRYGITTEEIPADFAMQAELSDLTAADEEDEEEEAARIPPDPALTARIAEQADWEYPWSARTKIPAKLAVTAIVQKQKESDGTIHMPQPSFMQKKGFSPAERGSIFHRALQFADYAAGRDDPAAELKRLEDLRYLTPEEAETISLTAFSNFFRSGLMERILSADKVWREYRFFDTIPADQAGYDSADPILIQGIADCLFEEDGAGILVDYKTDYASPAELIARYQPQLLLYRQALSQLFPKGIRQCLLYSLTLNTVVGVPLPPLED